MNSTLIFDTQERLFVNLDLSRTEYFQKADRWSEDKAKRWCENQNSWVAGDHEVRYEWVEVVR